MNTIAINFTDMVGHFWKMEWTPTTTKKKNLTAQDVQAVIHYIKTGKWPLHTSVAAKNCFDFAIQFQSKGVQTLLYRGYPARKGVCNKG